MNSCAPFCHQTTLLDQYHLLILHSYFLLNHYLYSLNLREEFRGPIFYLNHFILSLLDLAQALVYSKFWCSFVIDFSLLFSKMDCLVSKLCLCCRPSKFMVIITRVDLSSHFHLFLSCEKLTQIHPFLV